MASIEIRTSTGEDIRVTTADANTGAFEDWFKQAPADDVLTVDSQMGTVLVQKRHITRIIVN